MATDVALVWGSTMSVRRGRVRIGRVWSQVILSRPIASKTSRGFAPAVLEADLDALEDLALALIVGPTLAEAEADFASGQTFTLDEWLQDDDEDA